MAGTEALNIVITAENSDVIRKIEEIVRAISGVQGKSITLNADSSKVTEAVNEANSKIDNVSGKEISLRADGSQAEQEIAGVSASMQAVNDTEANISVSGAGEAVAKADEVSSAMAGVSSTNAEINIENSQALGAVEQVADAQEAIKDAHSEFTADGSQAVQEAEKVSDATKNVNDTHVEITADGSQAIDEAGRVANAEQNIQGVHSEITANGAQAIGEAGAVQSVLDGVTDKEAKVTVDTSQAESAAGQAKAALDGVTDKNVKVTVDDSQIEDAKRKFEQFIAEFNGKKVTFTVTAGKAQVFKDIYGRLYDIHGNIVSIGRKAGEGFAKEFSSAANNGINSVKEQFNALLAMNVGEKISASFGAAFSTITSMLQKVANTISGVMRSALSVGGGFEAQMTTVKVISGATEEELDALTKKAREMGATLPITAKDAATAMQMLVQRGTSAADTLATVDSVANLAIAQSTNMGEVAELLGTAMSSFSIDIGEAAKVTAVFNNACNQSPLNMQRLMAAMKYAAPAAGSLGISLTEAVAAMEAISRVLPSGEMTGTGYAMVLSKIAAKSEIAGVKTHNLDGSLRSVKDIFLDLKKAQASYAELNKVFGQRGVKAALALQQNAEALEEYEARLKDYGTTQGAVDEKAKTFTNTMAALTSAIEEFHINVFNQIKDKSKETVGGITAIVRAFSAWVEETQIAGKALNAFLEGVGFKIPSADDFRRFLDELDIQAFVDKVKDLGESLRDIGDKILGAVDKIKSPLLWLIEHLDTFMTISFWGWISGKALQVPAAIMGIAFAFKELAAAGKLLAGIGWATMLNPIGAIVGIAGAIGGPLAYSANKMFTAKAELKEALNEEKRYLAEQGKADLTLPFEIKFNLKTGFEKLPESWVKASDQVRAEADATVKVIQEQFKGKVAEAVEFVAGKFPEMSAALAELADDSDVIMARISASLHGDEQAFEALPEFYRKVVERINAIDLGMDKIGNDFAAISKKYVELKQEIEKPLTSPIDPNTALLQSISSAVQSVMTELPAEIERAKQFLNGSDGQLAVEVSLSGAKEKLEKFVKSISKEHSIPHSLVENTIANQLKELAHAGDTTAASLLDGWGKVGNEFENFIQRAKDAVNFLGATPQTFDTAIEHLLKGIKEVDPITGKVTEQFKKAYNTLKEWNNLSFSKLTQSLNMLKKAIEGGFIDKKELEKTFQSVSNQVKLKVVTDLKPMESMLSPKAFQSSVASEYISVMQELGGDTFLKKVKEEFSQISAQSGEAMGRAILAHVDSEVIRGQGTFTIDGADQITQGLGSIASLPQNIADAVSPYVMRLEQLNPIQGGATQASTASPVQVSATPTNSANDFSSLTVEFQKLTVAIDGAKSFIEGNTSALKAVSEGVLKLVNSAGNSSQGVSYATIKDYSADIASVAKAMQDFSAANVQAVNLIEAAVKSQSQQQSFTPSANTLSGDVVNRITPYPSNEQNTAQNLNVDWSPVITALQDVSGAVNSVELAVKAQQEGITFDAGALAQALISGIAPFISSIEQTRGAYQDSSLTLAGNIQSLGQNIDSLSKSTESNISALSQLQNAISSYQGENNSVELSQVISELQAISSALKATQNQNGDSQNLNSALSPIIEALKNVSTGLADVQNNTQANVQAVNSVVTAVNSVEKAVAAQQTVNEGSITQGVIDGFAPLVSKIEQNTSTYQSASSSMTRALQDLGTIIDTMKKSVDSSNSTMIQLQASVKAAADSYDATNITSAVTPIAGAVQNLATALSAIQVIQQANSAALSDVINSVRSVESALKAMNAGNTYDIDIIQQGFNVGSKSDADYTARSAATALRSGIGNGGI